MEYDSTVDEAAQELRVWRMMDFDHMPRWKRDLVNEYGFNIVTQIPERFQRDPMACAELLRQWRANRAL